MALAFCILFIAGFVFFSSFSMAHANHAHDYKLMDECAICVCLVSIKRLLMLCNAVSSIAALGIFLSFSRLPRIIAHECFSTPVVLKVRMNN